MKACSSPWLTFVVVVASAGSVLAGDADKGAAAGPPLPLYDRPVSQQRRGGEPKLDAAANLRTAGATDDSPGRPPELLPLPGELEKMPFATDADGRRRVAARQEQPLDDDEFLEGESQDPLAVEHVETTMNDILPYFDYEPARVAAQERDCQSICPCPDGDDCRKPGGRRPCPCPEADIKRPWVTGVYDPRAFDEAVFAWDASNIYSYPLYFEDKQLERYGHTYCEVLQPFASVARFGGQLALLPYQMTIKPPLERRYPLGYYRPGEWAPKLHYQIPLNARAGLVQAGVMTGAHLIFP